MSHDFCEHFFSWTACDWFFASGIPQCGGALRPVDRAMSHSRSYFMPHRIISGISTFLLTFHSLSKKEKLPPHFHLTLSEQNLPVSALYLMCSVSQLMIWRELIKGLYPICSQQLRMTNLAGFGHITCYHLTVYPYLLCVKTLGAIEFSSF